MKNPSFIFMALLAAGLAARAPGQDQGPAATAVLTLNCSGLSGADADFLSERLMIELSRTGRFQVMERAQRDQILKEREFSMSGACDAATCLVEAGRLLAVRKAVGGSVGQLGQVISVQVRLVDIATGAVEATAVRDYRGGLEVLLTSGMREVARELAGLAKPQPADSVAPPASLALKPAMPSQPAPKPGPAAKKYPRARPTSSLRMPVLTYGSWALAAGFGMLSLAYHHQASGYQEILGRETDQVQRDGLRASEEDCSQRSKTAGYCALGCLGLGTVTSLMRERHGASGSKAQVPDESPKLAFRTCREGMGIALVGRM